MNEKIDKYEIERIEKDGKFYVKIYNNKAKKEWNRQIAYYNFGTDIKRREEYIENFKSNVKTRVEEKADRMAKRKAFVNPAKVGDVLCSSWGYDQTNVDYYQVTKVKGKMVEIREIGGRSIEGSTYSHGMADEVKPAKDSFRDSEPMMKRVKGAYMSEGYAVTIASYTDAYLISPEEKHYRSWYA